MIGFLVFLFVCGISCYYFFVAFKFYTDDFDTKKEMLKALFPFWYWVKISMDKFRNLQ